MMEKEEKERSEMIETSGKVHFTVLNFVRLLLLIAFIGAYLNKRWLVFFTAGLALFVTFLPTLLHHRWGIKIPAEFEVTILLLIYGSLFFGEVRGFYAEYWWWDVLLNFVAALALGFVGLTILYVLYRDEKIDASPFIIALFAFCFAVAVGTLWEFFEFSMDYFFGFNMQKSGLNDTIGDLLVNAAGAFVVSVAGYVYMKQGRKNVISSLIISFIEKNPFLFKSKRGVSPAARVQRLIEKGEHEQLEFKSTLRTNVHTGAPDKKIEQSVLKTICGFLNSNGGTVLIGVGDNGGILGIEHDKFPNIDKLTVHFMNLVKQCVGGAYLPFIQFLVIAMEKEKHVLRVDCRRSNTPVFLKFDSSEEFYVRNGPSCARLSGSALLEYVAHRFKER